MPLKVYKRGEVYHYSGTVAGKRLRGSTGTASKEIAQQIAAREEARAWKRDLHGPEAVLTFADAAVLYRSARKSDRFLARIEDYWKDTLIKDITGGAIRQMAMELYPKAAASSRNRQAIVPTQAIINHCAESDLCPPIRVKRFKEETKIKVPASWEWIQAFVAHSKPHLGALAMFMFLTGARISEALAVTWDDIDLHAQTVLIKQTKVGAERLAHLPPVLMIRLANLPRDRKPFQYKNRNLMVRVWRRACARAGIEVLSPHCCRHGFATHMLRAGFDPVTVAKRGGWKTPRHIFETYGHAMDDITITDRLTGSSVPQLTGPIQNSTANKG
jgi:integrase